MRQHFRAFFFILLCITADYSFAGGVLYVRSHADGGPGSLRACIEAANKSFGRTEIIIDGGGFEVSSHLEILGDVAIVARHQAVVNIPFAEDRVFIIRDHARASFYNIKITGEFNYGVGGGILNYGGLEMIKCEVSGNLAPYDSPEACKRAGGGIYNVGNLSLLLCTISQNYADDGRNELTGDTWNGSDGGGIYNMGTCVINCCTIAANSAGNGIRISNAAIRGGNGGGIFNRGQLLIERSTIAGNVAGATVGFPAAGFSSATKFGTGGSGGGLFNAGSVSVVNSTISGNGAGYGGDARGQYFQAVDGGDGGNGGGIFNAGPARLTSCTVAFNYAGFGGSGYGATPPDAGSQLGIGGHGGSGGGIFSTNATLDLRNTLVAENHFGKGGAGGSSDQWLLSTTLLRPAEELGATAPNGPDGTSPDVTGRIHSGGYNLVSIVDDLNSPWVAQDIVGVGDDTGAPNHLDEVRLGPLQMNGGPTATHAVSDSSRAAHSGNRFGLKIDQRGYSRLNHVESTPNSGQDLNGASIGAFQLQPPPPLTGPSFP